MENMGMASFCEFSQQLKFIKTKGALNYQIKWSMLPVFSRVRAVHLLLILCICYFGYFMFFDVCVLFRCLVFVPGLHSFDFR